MWKDELIRRARPILDRIATGGEPSKDERLQAFGWLLRLDMELDCERQRALDKVRDSEPA